MVYLGLNKVYDEAPVHQFFMGEHFDQHMREVFQTKTIPQDPSFYTFNPSTIDPSLAPEGKECPIYAHSCSIRRSHQLGTRDRLCG